MARTVNVDLGERGYTIEIGVDLDITAALGDTKRALIITDSVVDSLFGEKAQAQVAARGIDVRRAVVPTGEESKSIDCATHLYRDALAFGLDRSAVIVALGGGVVGDLAGFVAATYLRGVRYVQVPTTLLAMVDSSVGGKTAVNLPEGKNLVGVYHQPVGVSSDLGMLSTLPTREYAAGLAEVVKYGVIRDADLFDQIEASADAILERDVRVMESIIARCCEIKAEVVSADEREGGLRAILNFGHTFGHALEQVSGYGGLLHGEAVSVGMAYAAALSGRERGLDAADQQRILRLLERFALPISLRGAEWDGASGEAWKNLRRTMSVDKKSQAGRPQFVLADRIGAASPGHEVSDGTMHEVYEATR